VTAQEPTRRGRPRRASTDDRILTAALDLLRTGGPSAVTVESVALRSTVARTTIYRRYHGRSDLLRAAIDRIAQQEVPPQQLSVRDKLRWVLERVRLVLEQGLGRGGVAAVLTNSAPEFTEAFRRSLTAHLQPLQESIAADAQRGLLRTDLDADMTINLIFGSYLAEMLRYGQPRDDWMDRTLDILETALRSTPTANQHPPT
jgi:AcrR family transcriptional regulator